MYSKTPEHFVVFDLEWNMPTPRSRVSDEVKAQIPYEIIEIGAVRIDRRGRRTGRFQTTVKPVVYPELNRYVAQVTNRFGSSLKFGQSFPDAAREFQEFCGDSFALCTWSDSDAKPLKQNLGFHKLDDQLRVRVLDVQAAFNAVFEPGAPQRSIEYALDYLRIPKKQPFHQAVSDAIYTGEVLEEVLRSAQAERSGVSHEEVTEVSEDTLLEIMDRFSYNPDIELSSRLKLEPVAERAGILPALEAAETVCPACHSPLMRSGNGWEEMGKHFESEYVCPEHGLITAKGRPRRDQNGQYRIILSLRIQNS